MAQDFLEHEQDLLQQPFHALLVSGGDGRMHLDPGTGLNKYGCGPYPREALPLGSCTASSPTPRAIEAVKSAKRKLSSALTRDQLVAESHRMMLSIRMDLIKELGLEDSPGLRVMLTPSGTDAEMLATLLALRDHSKRLCNIVCAPSEVGSGTTYAAEGRHFDDQSPRGAFIAAGDPVNSALNDRVDVATIVLRNSAGEVRHATDLDAEVRQVAEDAIASGRRVMVHLVAHSKTGAHAPSRSCIRDLQQRYPDDVVVMVDAAQGRISRRGLREVLDQGCVVLFTGSKFYGGPPFAGALLAPQELTPNPGSLDRLPAEFRGYFTAGELPTEWSRWRSSLSNQPNLGLVLRWSAALAEIKAYYQADPTERYRVLRAFEAMVPDVFMPSALIDLEAVSPPVADDGRTPLLESKKTVFPFYIRSTPEAPTLDRAALLNLMEWTNQDISAAFPDAPAEVRDLLSKQFHLGQPVVTSKRNRLALLRLALGGPLIVRLCQDDSLGSTLDRRLDWLRAQLVTLRAKLEYLAVHYDTTVIRMTQHHHAGPHDH